MLCGVAGIESQTLGNSASYLQSWISRLKSDSRRGGLSCSSSTESS